MALKAFAQRNIKCCDRKLKAQAYKQYVRPILEYTFSAWDLHTWKKH